MTKEELTAFAVRMRLGDDVRILRDEPTDLSYWLEIWAGTRFEKTKLFRQLGAMLVWTDGVETSVPVLALKDLQQWRRDFVLAAIELRLALPAARS